MSTHPESDKQAISRHAEEQYLKRTLTIVKDNLAHYGQEVSRMQEDIDEMLAHYHDNDVEVLTILNNTVTLHDHMKRALCGMKKHRTSRILAELFFMTKLLTR